MELGDIVKFSSEGKIVEGKVTRIWDRPNAPYVTIMVGSKTFVRLAREVIAR